MDWKQGLGRSLSTTEAAAFLGCSRDTVHREIADGQLLAFRLGTRVLRVDRESFEQYVAELRATPAQDEHLVAVMRERRRQRNEAELRRREAEARDGA